MLQLCRLRATVTTVCVTIASPDTLFAQLGAGTSVVAFYVDVKSIFSEVTVPYVAKNYFENNPTQAHLEVQ